MIRIFRFTCCEVVQTQNSS